MDLQPILFSGFGLEMNDFFPLMHEEEEEENEDLSVLQKVSQK